MDAQSSLIPRPPFHPRVPVSSLGGLSWRRMILSALVIFAMGSTAAFSQSTYFLYLDQTGAQTQVDVDHFSSWHIIVASGASFVLGGGNFAMKKGNSASATAVLTLYDGSNTSGTVLASKELTNSSFTGQFNPVAFTFDSAQTLGSGRYYVTLTSTAVDTQNQAYFVKGVQNAIISIDGTDANELPASTAGVSSSPASANLALSKTATSSVATSGTITYGLTLGNDGGSPSGTSATILDQLPAGVTATAATAGTGVSSVSCTNLNTAAAALTCTVTLSSALASGASPDASGAPKFTITATAPSSAGSITNYASVDPAGSTSPATPGTSCTTTSCASAATTVTGSAGFTVTESSGSTSVSETATTDTFTVVLDSQPTTDVVRPLTSARDFQKLR